MTTGKAIDAEAFAADRRRVRRHAAIPHATALDPRSSCGVREVIEAAATLLAHAARRSPSPARPSRGTPAAELES